MKIGIDARMLGPECGGLGRYVEQLVVHLHEIDQENQYVLFLKQDNWDYVRTHDHMPNRWYVEQYYNLPQEEHRGITLTQPNFTKVLADVHWYGWEEQLRLPRIIKEQQLDLMHFPHWNVPLTFNDPFVVTIHDLLLLHYPTREASMLGPLSYWIKHTAYRKVLHHAVHGATHILTPSEFSRRDIHHTLNVALENITVTYEAPFLTHQKQLGAEDSSILTTYGIEKPYAMYVGVSYPHKNLGGLLSAWEKMKEHYGGDFQLVLVGKDNYFYKRLKATHRLKHTDTSVVFTGFVEDEALHELYKQARLYVFPSLYEGFGLPPLEAMTHGVPVVSSNRTCLPEILGEAALYADPENADQFARALYEGLTNEDVRFDLNMRAKEELKRYSWKKMALETKDIYERAVKQG